MTRHALLIAPIALLLAAAAVVTAGCGSSPPPASAAPTNTAAAPAAPGEIRLPPDSPQLKRITLARVTTAQVAQDQVVAPGAIEAIPTRIARLAMPVAGRVTRVLVGLGDRVTRGEPVVAIDSPEAATMLSGAAQAEARVRQMQAALRKAETDAARAHDLFEHNAAAQKDVEAADTQLAQAGGDLDQARAQLEENQHHLRIVGLTAGPGASREILLRAPVSGKVITIEVSPGEYRSDTAAALMTIADLAIVHVAADVPESQIRLITQGEHVLVTLAAYPGEKFDAKVTRVGDTVDSKTRSVKVLAELPNPANRLRPGMFGRIEHTKTMRETPVVPSSAVVQTEKENLAVREKAPGVFEVVRVECGARIDDNRIPILKGLQAGDRIVVDGTLLLSGSATP